jgi:serine/threonine protein kinase
VTTELRAQLQLTLGSVYVFERELGGGGMSRVFLAEEVSLGRRIVVKVLPPELAAEVSIERFKREIQLGGSAKRMNSVPGRWSPFEPNPCSTAFAEIRASRRCSRRLVRMGQPRRSGKAR